MYFVHFRNSIRKKLLLIIAIVLLICNVAVVYSSASTEVEPIPIDEYIIVGMNHAYSFPEKPYDPEYFDSEKVSRVETIFSYHEGDLKQLDSFNRIEKLYLSEEGKKNIDLFIKELNQREDIFVAERDYEYQNGLAIVHSEDEFFEEQYALKKIMAQKAWAITTGSPSMRVGVIDSGIMATHPDLLTNVSTSLSKDFINNTYGSEDENGHGTYVAGLLGARGNNTIGISGICWNVKMISLRVSDSSNQWTNTRVISAIEYASANNISILNMSIQNGSYCATLENTIANYSGLCVVAAGNISDSDHNFTNIRYPARYNLSNMIVVAATNSADDLGTTSKYHPSYVNLGAPGQAVYTTTINNAQPYSKTIPSGSSLAAPYVAGTLALMRSANINLTSAQLKSRLLNSVDSISSLSDLFSSGGRLNTFRAVRKAKGYLMGDANLDGTVDISDARQVLRWSVELDPYTNLNEALCDVDYSGNIDPEDSRLIQRMTVHLIDPIE